MESSQWALKTVLKTVNSLQVNQAFELLSLCNKKRRITEVVKKLLAKEHGVKSLLALPQKIGIIFSAKNVFENTALLYEVKSERIFEISFLGQITQW